MHAAGLSMASGGDAPPAGAHVGDARLECERYEHACVLMLLSRAAAHQVNSPLNAVMLNAELACSRAPPGAVAMRRSLDKVMSEVARCAEAGRALSRFAEAPPHAPTRQAVDTLVREGCALAAPDLSRRGARLTVALEALPQLRVDAVALRTVVLVLLRDAAVRGPEGVAVAVHGTCEEGHVLFGVRDDGPPLPEALLQGVCNPFRAADRQVARYLLGAGVVGHVASCHGGTLGVCSREGEGTCFELRLPAGARSPC